MSKFKTINVDLQTKERVELLSKKFGLSQNNVIGLMAKHFAKSDIGTPELKKVVLSNELFALRNSITSLQSITNELRYTVFKNTSDEEEQVSENFRKLLLIIKEFLIQTEYKSTGLDKAMVLDVDQAELEKIIKQLDIFIS